MKLKKLIILSTLVVFYSSCKCGFTVECWGIQPYEFYITFKNSQTDKTIQSSKVKIKIDSTKSIDLFSTTETFGKIDTSNQIDTLYRVNFFPKGSKINHEVILTLNDTLKIPLTLELNEIPKSACCPAFIDGLKQVVVTKPNSKVGLSDITRPNTIVTKNAKLLTVKL
jgi:hypothetical protein